METPWSHPPDKIVLNNHVLMAIRERNPIGSIWVVKKKKVTKSMESKRFCSLM
jgi:hypothetical protein